MTTAPTLLPLTLAATRDLLRNHVLLFFTFPAPLAFLIAFALLFSTAGPGPLHAATPGLLGWTIAASAALGTAVPLASWRRSGLLRQLRRTPAGWPPVLLARLLALLGHTAWQLAGHLGVAVLLGFRAQRWWPLPLYLVAGTLAFAGLGLLVGALTSSADRAAAVTLLLLIPMAATSGTFVNDAPDWVHSVVAVLPTRWQRNGLLDASGGLWPVLALLAFGLCAGALAVLRCAREDRLSP